MTATMTTRNEILGWMRKGVERGKTIPDFNELLDAFVAEVREEECQKREKAVEAERGRILKELSQYGINPPTMQSFVLNVHEFRKLITQPNNTK